MPDLNASGHQPSAQDDCQDPVPRTAGLQASPRNFLNRQSKGNDQPKRTLVSRSEYEALVLAYCSNLLRLLPQLAQCLYKA